MGIVGDHPEGGVRFDLDRKSGDAASGYVYEGSAFTHDVEHRVCARVDASGVVTVDDEASLPKEVASRAKLLLKTAWKHARDEGEGVAPPRRIHRWRSG
jgi:hypothetical protein